MKFQFPMRCNINVPVEGKVLEYVKLVNYEIYSRYGSEIYFDKNHNCYPHITILMGYVKSEEKLKKIINKLSQFTQCTSSFFYSVLEPCIIEGSSYIFLELIDSKRVFDIKIKVQEITSGLIEINEFGDSNTIPHVTVAYTNTDLRLNIAHLQKKSVSSATKINISKVGIRGTCTDIISSQNLK